MCVTAGCRLAVWITGRRSSRPWKDLPGRAAEAGRDFESIEVSMFLEEVPPPALVEDMQASGVTRIVVDFHCEDREGMLRQLDHISNAAT